jgi:5-(carboxyamino)imidazole ribonucleotide synthase
MLCDLPAGSVALDRPVVMLNLLGDLWGDTQPQWQTLYAEDSSYLHLYGKKQALVGRKMGHVNLLGDDRDQLLQRARDLKQALAS